MSLKRKMLLERIERQAAAMNSFFLARIVSANQNPAGLFVLDPEAGCEPSRLREPLAGVMGEYGFSLAEAGGDPGATGGHGAAPAAPAADNYCQVTVEERAQLFAGINKS